MHVPLYDIGHTYAICVYCWSDSCYLPKCLLHCNLLSNLDTTISLVLLYVCKFPTGLILPVFCPVSLFRVLWPSLMLWLGLQLLTWPGRLLCMDIRRLHFGMIEDGNCNNLHSYSATCFICLWLFLQVVAPLCWSMYMADNWQCERAVSIYDMSILKGYSCYGGLNMS